MKVGQPQNRMNKLENALSRQQKTSPWAWIPTLYFAEGIPYVIVTILSVIMYKKMGIGNTNIAIYTSWLYLPWVIKPFWSPFVDMFKTKRWWIVSMEILIGAGLAGVAWGLQTDYYVRISLILMWLVGFSSATHDIAADGFYMLGLSSHQQSLFVGIRSTFYRISMIAGQGALVFLAGWLEKKTGDIKMAWTLTIYLSAGLMLMAGLYHLARLPHATNDCEFEEKKFKKSPTLLFWRTFYKFFSKKNIKLALAFILLFRLGEAQLGKMGAPFMLDPINKGGLGLTTMDVGFVYGTIGVIALTLGGVLGGYLVAKNGLKNWFWPMVMSMNIPNLVYVYLAWAQPQNITLISALVGFEQFGYGFGFTAFMMYLIYFSQGRNKTSYYAICTGIMALGMMLPGLIAGYIQTVLGYEKFFIWVCLCTLPGFILALFLPINSEFGKKNTD